MRYTDGYATDDAFRMVKCPICKNVEFSYGAGFCRICGQNLYNRCEGTFSPEYEEVITHANPGNARYCETCGMETRFLKEGILRPWQEVVDSFTDDDETEGFKPILQSPPQYSENMQTIDEDDDLPF